MTHIYVILIANYVSDRKLIEFALFVMISPATSPNGSPNMLTKENEKLFPSLAMCGSFFYPYPDDYPQGYPFDRKLEVDFQISKKKGNYAFYPPVIKHKLQDPINLSFVTKDNCDAWSILFLVVDVHAFS